VVTPNGEGIVIDVAPLSGMITVKFDEVGNGRPARQTFHCDDIEPWDELEALRRKSEAPCDKHEGGECDCGKDKVKGKKDGS